jgi:hypothetical protein
VISAPVQHNSGAGEVFVIHQFPAFGAWYIDTLGLVSLNRRPNGGLGFEAKYRLLFLLACTDALKSHFVDPKTSAPGTSVQ